MPRIKPGDKVRVIAPGGAFDPARLAAGEAILTEWGLQVSHDTDIVARHNYFAGDDARRQNELAAALGDAEAAIIWAARGGYGTSRLLPRLDTTRLIARPRWLVGYSDISALHCAWARASVPSMHACNVIDLPQWSAAARAALWAGLSGQPMPPLPGRWAVAPRATVRGRLLGGNLTVLASLAGTGAWPPFTDTIVFIEDVGERPYRLDRCVTQLVQAGALATAQAVVVGQLTDCHPPQTDGLGALDAVVGALAPTGLPVLVGVPVGHGDDSWPVPLGRPVTLDAATAQVRFTEAI